MRKNAKGVMEHYCARHWKKHIESDPAFMNAVKTWEDSLFPRGRKRTTKTVRRRVVRKSALPQRRVTVVRRKK